MLSGKHIIGMQDVGGNSAVFQAIDPRSGETLPVAFQEGTSAEVDRAATLAARHFDAVRNVPNARRADFLEAIAEEILALGEALIERTMAETALPAGRLTGERGRTMGQLKLFAQVVREGSFVEARIDTALPDRQPLPRADIRMMNIALGPVAVFGASNFPLAFSVAGGDTAAALAAGCPAIVKGHPAHPGASEMVAQAIRTAARKSGMPEGTFSLIQGSGYGVGEALVRHPAVKAVGFTGSYSGGKALFNLAASRPEPIPVYAEMGSTNPVFILPGALADHRTAIAEGLANSVTLGVGQFCTNPGLVLAMDGEPFEAFVQSAAAAMEQKPADTMLHAGIHRGYESSIRDVLSVEEVRLVAEGGSAEGFQAMPRLLRTSGRTFIDYPRLEEEVFGPSSILIACASREEMLGIAEKLGGHLTATLHGSEAELDDYRDLVTILERKAGRLLFNGFPTGVEVCHAMVHGGPFPATTDSRTTSVGTAAIKRFLRPVCYQSFPQALLPAALQDGNPHQQWRLVNGAWRNGDIR